VCALMSVHVHAHVCAYNACISLFIGRLRVLATKTKDSAIKTDNLQFFLIL